MQAPWIFLKGLLMGVADIVPGVSGGTMAFITGIYDRLVGSIAELSTAGKDLLQGKLRKANENIDWALFLPLGLGIAIAFLIGSAFIPQLMEAYPAAIFSFFIGLILASSYIVWKHIRKHTIATASLAALGMIIGAGIASAPFLSTAPSKIFLFLLGMIAITAMILPGISGSYILLMFGQYKYMLETIHERNITAILAFGAGAVLGLLLFAHLLRWLLREHHSLTFSALLGIMLGALVRPGRIAIESMTSAWLAIVLLAAGALAVILVEMLASRKS